MCREERCPKHMYLIKNYMSSSQEDLVTQRLNCFSGIYFDFSIPQFHSCKMGIQ